MAESTDMPSAATEAEGSADLADRFFKFDVEVFPKVATRAEVVAQLAAWLENQESGPSNLPAAIVLACEDLQRELDGLNDYVHRLGLDVGKAIEQA